VVDFQVGFGDDLSNLSGQGAMDNSEADSGGGGGGGSAGGPPTDTMDALDGKRTSLVPLLKRQSRRERLPLQGDTSRLDPVFKQSSSPPGSE